MVVSLQHQFIAAKQSKQKLNQELERTKAKLSNYKNDQIIATRERDKLQRQVFQLSRQKENVNARLHEMSREMDRIRRKLDRTLREKREAVEKSDHQKDIQIQDLQRSVESQSQYHEVSIFTSLVPQKSRCMDRVPVINPIHSIWGGN